ncbi:hypothetical protein OCF56_21290 [Bacillus mycoides]|uniref:hypothetical protein n=1 Tax=Bacillus mycoides TaxID=1405 RepID=UPI0021CD74BC|nr:hypothetical protein [Bacillus mycoides]MCU5656418.1 hypothetical protein [Bacillus mycoides]
MKLTLFTISNEQIKESLNKLQTKVESLETVKDVQDKIISTKDSQISFLNDQIANIWASISFVASITGIIASGAFAYVTYLNRQAQKKVERSEALIIQNKETTTIAQDTLDKLTSLSANLITLQKANAILSNINNKLYFIENNLNNSKDEMCESHFKTPEEQLILLNHFTNKYHLLRVASSSTLLKINHAAKQEQELRVSDLEELNQLEEQVEKLHADILDNLYEQD